MTIYDRLGLTDREAALNTVHDPENMTMPGHDCKVPEGFFDGRNPTWVEGILVYGEGPGTDLFQRAKAGHEAGTGDFFRFGPKDGFPDQGIIILERGPQN